MRFLALIVFVLCPAVSAQPRFGVGAGVAVPTRGLAEFRSPGPHLALSAALGTDRRGFGGRAELTASFFPGEPPPPRQDAAISEDYTTLGLRGSLVYTFSNRPRAVYYALVGGGAYSLAITDAFVEQRTTSGVHVGVGTTLPVGRTRLAVEAQAVTLLASYGGGEFDWVNVYVPLTVGIRF